MPDSRLETTRLLAKVFNIEDFLSPDSLSHDELNYYNNITRVLDSHIDKYVDWLGTPEAQEAFYQESVQRKEYFQSIDDDLDAIIDNHKLTADKIIEKIYRRGLKKGYTEISRRPVFNDACKYGLKATQDYNFELITNLSDDLRESIKHDIFKGIAEEKSIHEVARSITDAGLKPLKDKTLTAYQRASLIARTEISRSMSTGRLQAYANYGVEKVTILTAGDSNVCPICLEAAAKDDVLIEYTLKEAQGLIPFHPACRCSIRAVIKHVSIDDLDKPQIINLTPNATEAADDITDAHLNDTLTLEKLNKMTFDELAKHHNITYAGVEKYSYDGKKYHKFVETFDDGRDFVARFEEGAVKSYLKQGIATPNEIIHEVFKVPKILRNETREIWFKNNNAGIIHKGTKTGYDSFSQRTAGYNAHTRMQDKRFFPDQVDFNHCIVINPKYFKGGGKGRYAFLWEQDPEKITSWKKTIHHEFTHSIDNTKEQWDANDAIPVSYGEEYLDIDHSRKNKDDLPGFTWYAGTSRQESYAEHGGYISYMFANPSEQKKKITIEYRTKEGKITKDINFEEYKELYPRHYEYFTKKLELV